MKKIYKLTSVFLTLTIFLWGMNACVDPDDKVTENAKEGGAILTAEKSLGKLLGSELPDQTVNITESELDFQLEIVSGGDDVTSYTIMKSYNGGVGVEVATVNSLPYTVNYTSLDDYLEGFEGVSSTDLRIGDVFQFYTMINVNNGNEFRSAPGAGTYDIVVNCASALAGSYTMEGARDDGGTYSFPVTITELSPGQYQSSRSGSWDPGASFFDSGEARMIFSDICGGLTIPEQGLNLGQYGNLQYGEGSVDPITGVITYVYTIEFGSGNVIYTETLTPQ